MTSTAADRLTSAASRLFQDKGFTRVGINEIIREADVAKMSLYNNFASKEDLALAAYEVISANRQADIERVVNHAREPRGAILAIFDYFAERTKSPTYRGCSFINLYAHVDQSDKRLMNVVRTHKMKIATVFAKLAEEMGVENPEETARQLLVLLDGAQVGASIERSIEPVVAAKAVAERLLGKTNESTA